MKKLLGFVLSALFLMVGCQDDNSILSPTDDLQVESGSPKGRIIVPKYISLPDDGSLAKTIETKEAWSIEALIPADEDNVLKIVREYYGGVHGVVKVEVKLIIYKGTFEEDAYVALYVDKENGTIFFKSSQVFNKDAKLWAKYEGIDLKSAVGPEIDFIYEPEYGMIESVTYKEIKYDLEKGKIELTEGLVSQFTQYGFITEQ